ncbi:hypothetical protein [Serratia proteamaculans]|uniref:hypothetical protein n=1 Tax=Serratia proteamaculans TaxID=28151 RepID=UPI0039B123F9
MDAVTNIRKKYILNLDVLKAGDIILEHGYKTHSLVIMKVTNSHYSHAMLYEGSTIIEATSSGGVFSRVPNRFAVVNKNDLKVLRLKNEIEPSEIENITTISRTLIGSSYSKLEALKAGGKKKPNTKVVTGQFCSRLVAQCFDLGGIKLVDNINYCSPADFENSPYLVEIDGAVKEASEKELAHALAPTPHRKHQESTVQWVKEAKKILKKSNIEAETINDIYSATLRLKNPKVDKLILKVIQASGHYTFYLEDKKENPFRYDEQAFSEKAGVNLDIINSEIHKEISIVKVQSTNLKNSRENKKIHPSCLMDAEINLYLNILGITKERLNVIVSHCESRGLIPELLTTAQSMINYIEKI